MRVLKPLELLGLILVAAIGIGVFMVQPARGQGQPNTMGSGTQLTPTSVAIGDSNGTCVLSNGSGPKANESCTMNLPALNVVGTVDAGSLSVVSSASLPSGTAVGAMT